MFSHEMVGGTRCLLEGSQIKEIESEMDCQAIEKAHDDCMRHVESPQQGSSQGGN